MVCMTFKISTLAFMCGPKPLLSTKRNQASQEVPVTCLRQRATSQDSVKHFTTSETKEAVNYPEVMPKAHKLCGYGITE